MLNLTKSPAWYRVRKALERELLVNDELRKGQPAKLRLGDVLEDEGAGLPDPGDLVQRVTK